MIAPDGRHAGPEGVLSGTEEATVGAVVLDDVAAFVGRFVALPSPAALVAVTLWAGHAHAVDDAESSPRLAFLSPEPASGKTRCLEVLELLVPSPMHAVNATPAALFRAVKDITPRPTILFDEIDTVFGPKAKENEEVRGLLNAGHRRGAVAYRCVGEGTKQTVTPFPAYCAVALAGLGDLPDTIMTRAVVIRMRRRAPGERVEPFRRRALVDAGHALRDRLAEWAAGAGLAGAWPAMPDGIDDRPADVWEPLLAVAEAAGGSWPDRARAACVELVTAANADNSGSLGLRLLADLREVFGDAPALTTETVLGKLWALDEAPWSDLRGRSLDSRGLAWRLRAYGVSSRNVRVGAVQAKGYDRADLIDAWSRYLPAPSAGDPSQPSHRPADTQTRTSDGESGRDGRDPGERPGTDASVPADGNVPAQTGLDLHGDGWDGWDASTAEGERDRPDDADSRRWAQQAAGYDS